MMIMPLFILVGMLALLTGCVRDAVILIHPKTGKEAQCGPSQKLPRTNASVTALVIINSRDMNENSRSEEKKASGTISRRVAGFE